MESENSQTPCFSPNRLTVSCILSILSAEDNADIRENIWKEKMDTLWLGVNKYIWSGDDDLKLVEAPTEYEALIKLYQINFFDIGEFCLTSAAQKIDPPPEILSPESSPSEIKTYIDNIYEEVCRIKGKKTIPIWKLLIAEYGIVRLSEIPKV